MGEYMAKELLQFGAGNRQGLEIIVDARDFTEINQVQMALGQIKGASDVQLAGYDAGQGKFYIQYSGSPERLFRELQAICSLRLSLESTAYNTMKIRVE